MSKGPRVKCKDCGEILQSMYRHDMKKCECRIRTDSVTEEAARKIMLNLVLDDSDYHFVRCVLAEYFGTGIMVDGGDAYLKSSGPMQVLDPE